MPDLPTGTVTFLFTDVEGSTRLWEQQPLAMRQALTRHDAIIEGEVAQYAGVVVRPRGEGDSRFAVFARATDAVAAAAAIRQALWSEPWPTDAPLRVRLALHTGEADLREGDYYGAAVNRCARLRAVAHGGQTLLTQATACKLKLSSPRNCRIKTGMPTTQEGCMGEGHLPSPCGVLFGASPPFRCRRSRPVLRLAGYPAAIGASSPVAGGVASSSASLPRRRWEAPRR